MDRSPGAGRGIFATRRFEAGDLIEVCPVIVIGHEEAEAIKDTLLGHYVYGWNDGGVAVALGFGSLYNHRTPNNASYFMGDDDESLMIVAESTIEAGDEIHIDYTGGGETELWFDPR